MITSPQNPKLKLVRALQGRAKDRREAGAFLAEGVRLVEEALAAGWPFRFVLYGSQLSERGRALVEKLAGKVDVEQADDALLESISDTETSQGIIAVLELTNLELSNLKSPTFVLIPDQIRDPGNLGTLIRSAAAAGVDAVLIPPETADAFSPKVVRAGMGAHFRLAVYSLGWDEIRSLITGCAVFLADAGGQTSCWGADFRQPLALIVGGEAEGASQSARKLADRLVNIPMPGKIESLNAAAAGAILMFEVVRQRLYSKTFPMRHSRRS
ncbi:MAG: RNA methyltransferase [Anaerolineales bacterium]